MALTDVNLFRIDGTVGSVSNVQTAALNGGPLAGSRNRIINGDMRIDQRNDGASVTPADGAYTLDRWRAGASAASKFSVQQSTTAPPGFTNSLLATSLSAYSVTTNDNFEIMQYVEGYNVDDLAWGTANAKAITVSFWVRSSLTGTFGGSINNSAFNRSYPFSYTISSANTWEQKTIAVTGDTSGTWLTDNGIGLVLCVCLGAGTGRSGTAGSWSGSTLYSATGATSVVATNGATFYITGVQLEAGDTATPFERRSYGQELQLCKRYFHSTRSTAGCIIGATGYVQSSTLVYRLGYEYPVEMRTTPTIFFDGISVWDGSNVATLLSVSSNHSDRQRFDADCSVGGTALIAGRYCRIYQDTANASRFEFSAEL